MKNLLLILILCILTACGSGNGGGTNSVAPGAGPTQPTNPGGDPVPVGTATFVFRVLGSAGTTIMGAVYSDFAMGSQAETPLSYMLQGFAADYTVTGYNGAFIVNANQSVTVEVYRSGVLVDTRTGTNFHIVQN